MSNSPSEDRTEAAIDEVIAKVDESLTAIRKIGDTKKQKRTTDRLSSDRARCSIQSMIDDPLLNEEGSDICLCKHDRSKNGRCQGKCKSSD